jgi:glutamine amidotransferase
VIAVIDYGMGNLRSVQKALEAVGARAVVTSDPAVILGARSVVLPGVGAFRDCMNNLERLDLVEVVRRAAKSGKPFLGICLGLQLLFNQSSEFGHVAGLGLLAGKVVRFPHPHRDPAGGPPLKIPHMGWNTVHIERPNPLLADFPNDSYFYFVHSYYVIPEDPEVVATVTDYGGPFVSGIHHENLYAFQFHPEKSQKNGLALLRKFSELR